MTEQHAVIDCSSLAGDVRYVEADEVPIVVQTLADSVRDAETRALADWHAQQAELSRRRSVELKAHGEAMAKRAQLQGRLNEIAAGNDDLKVVLQALGLVAP